MMNDLGDLLSPGAIVAGAATPGKKKLLQSLATVAANVYSLDAVLVAERLAEREKLGSTGFGGGIALPHARIEGLDRVIGVFAQLARPIDFGAVDELPVDLVFMLLSPVDAGPEHLKALARVSRRLRDRSFANKLRGAGSADALYAMLTVVEARDAA